MTGILNMFKPAGWTSHDVVNKVRRLLKEKRIGHTGTLDPMATGVLVLCVGKATRIAAFLEAEEKEYEAVLRLGITTDTLDADGAVLESRAYAPPAREAVEGALLACTGVVSQVPPAYSAIKVNGVPSYKRARSGAPAPLKARTVTISSITLLDYADPLIRFHVRCSKGTYIRSLCRDIGELLGMGGHLAALVRTRSGGFKSEHALTLEQLALAVERNDAERLLVPIAKAVGLPVLSLDDAALSRVKQGGFVPAGGGLPSLPGGRQTVLACDGNGDAVAVAEVSGGFLRPKIVFLLFFALLMHKILANSL